MKTWKLTYQNNLACDYRVTAGHLEIADGLLVFRRSDPKAFSSTSSTSEIIAVYPSDGLLRCQITEGEPSDGVQPEKDERVAAA